jgi:hypothetical protein
MSNNELTRRSFIWLASAELAAVAVGMDAFGNGAKAASLKAPADRLAEAFIHPPQEARPRSYWYWMNGNITREGLLADLDGLARIGIGGVNFFDIALLPAGKVVNRSREWYELVDFAVEEAEKRNIKVSMNCPGWSGTGGPWITPELSMQELTWSETIVGADQRFPAVLQQPPTRLGYYRDAAVLAFPTPAGDEPLPIPQAVDIDGKPLPQAASALKLRPILSAHELFHAPGVRSDTPAPKEEAADLPAKFDLVFPYPVEVRSVFVRGTRAGGSFKIQMSAWDKASAAFLPVAILNSNDCGPFSDQIGSASFGAVKSSRFRLAFETRREGQRLQLEVLSLSAGFRVTDWTAKIGFSCKPINPNPEDLLPKNGDVIQLDQILDLTDKLEAGGKLNWSPPPGRWTILRIGYTPTGIYLFPTPEGGIGLDCDKLSREAADFHYDHCVKPVLKELGPTLTRRAMTYYHSDSYESGWQNWTAKFPEGFRERRGYDLVKYMPTLTGRAVGSLETTEQFLWDFRRTIGDLFADNNYGRLAERCHEDGIQFSAEPYGGPFEQLQVGLRPDQPMTEVWVQHPINGKKIPYQAVHAGHTSGRKLIGAESFTSAPPYGGMWKDHPFSLKALGDFMFCCGVNQYCFHVSTLQPFTDDHMRPGFTCGQNGIHFDRGETWWNHGGKEWVSYISRCQALLQSGEHVADFLYFQGNDSPAGVYPFEKELPNGYDFDACGSEILSGAGVQHGRIVLKCGKRYRYLVLPGHGRVTLASLRKIASLAKDGAKIVGMLPKESPSLADASGMREYQQLTSKLAAGLRADQSLEQILTADKLPPDFSYDEKQGMVLHTIHRQLEDTDFYFVASTSSNPGVIDCTFRVAGKIPALWYADTGVIEPCALYQESGGMTRIPLHFDPSGSVFVVFRSGLPKAHAIAVALTNTPAGSSVIPRTDFTGLLKSDGKKLELYATQPGRYLVNMADQQKHWLEVAALPSPKTVEGPWSVQFPPGWGAPEKINLGKLISWPEHADVGVRYFSGTAIYKTTFPSISLAPDCELFLDLGQVEVIAEVWLNGKSLGTFWKPPFVFGITELLRSQTNELELHITNLWPNRLIGDEQFPDDCTENGQWKSGVIPAWPEWLKNGQPRPESRRLTFCTWKHWRREDPLLVSGLLGPVTLRQVRKVNVT